MKKLTLLLGFLFSAIILFAQTPAAPVLHEVSGVIQDSTGVTIIGASIKLTSPKDTLTTVTNNDGIFVFKDVKSAQFTLTITSIGFATLNKRFLYSDATARIVLDPIVIRESSNLLKEVVVNGAPPVTMKEDTVEYRASDYQLREGAQVEDLLKRLPGVEVDKDGNVKTQGKEVTKIRVNGKDYFGGDVRTATQQLPADIVDKIQVVDDYGDQAAITGIRDGEPNKIINIQTKADKNKGYTARGTGGAGTEDRYVANASVNYFNGAQQISFLGNLNNTNLNLFTFGGGGGGNAGGGNRGGGAPQMMMGGAGGGRGGAGGGGSTSGGAGTGTVAFSTNGSDGFTNVSSIGLNYRDDWSKKLTSYGSYSYSNRNNDLIRSSLQQNTVQSSVISNDQLSVSNTITDSHRLNWNLEYRPDSLNYIKISPNFSYSKTSGAGTANFRLANPLSSVSNVGLRSESMATTTPSFGGEILYNHRFTKRGRNFSVSVNANSNDSENFNDATNNSTITTPGGTTTDYLRQQIDIDTKSLSTGTRISYNEPLSQRGNLEFNYNLNYTKYDNDRLTSDITPSGVITPNPLLSNNYQYDFMTNRFGMNYRFNEKKYNYSIGLAVQPAVLTGESSTLGTSYRRSSFNFIPVARYSYNFSRTKSFNINYNGRSNEPSYSQLQPVQDVSNPNFIVTGNPNLNAEFVHNLGLRFNNFNFSTGDVLFTNINATYTQNKIVTNTVNTAGSVVQETRYLNSDNGNYSMNAFYAFSRPFAERKYVLSLNGGANYSNSVLFVNSEENSGKNWVLNQGFSAQILPNKDIDINASVNYVYNQNKYSLPTLTDRSVSSWVFGLSSKTFFFKTWLLGADLSKTMNNGYSTTVTANPFIINTYLEKQLFKGNAGAIRLQAYDLLNESTSINTNINGNIITDSRSNRLARYFMLSFSMRLSRFGGQNVTAPEVPGQRTIIRN